MRYRSPKREELYKDRRKVVERLLSERPGCEACPAFAAFDAKVTYTQFPAVDIHELIRRSQGGSIIDEVNLLAVCRDCHRRIGNYPNLAYLLGVGLPGYADDEMASEAHRLRVSWSSGKPMQPSWMEGNCECGTEWSIVHDYCTTCGRPVK